MVQTVEKIKSAIKIIDKEVTLKALSNEGFFEEANPSEYCINAWDTYQENFSNRNEISIESIKKIFENDKEISEDKLDRVFEIQGIKKALEGTNLAEGLSIAMNVCLNNLFYNSEWTLEWFINGFVDKEDSTQLFYVKLINSFLANIKATRDDLYYITFKDGVINNVPVLKNIKKRYISHIDSWDIREVNNINDNLKTCLPLFQAFINCFPQDEKFNDFVKSLKASLKVMKEFDSNFKDLVLYANSLDIIRIAPKEIPDNINNVTPFFNEEVSKKKELVKKKLYQTKIVKNFQGLVTGIVLEPEKVDLQGQIISAEVIEKAMQEYMLNYSQFDIMHNEEILKSDKDSEGRQIGLIQNFLAPQDLIYNDQVVKKGTWLQEVFILDQEIKKDIEEGNLTGFSIFGTANIIPEV